MIFSLFESKEKRILKNSRSYIQMVYVDQELFILNLTIINTMPEYMYLVILLGIEPLFLIVLEVIKMLLEK